MDEIQVPKGLSPVNPKQSSLGENPQEIKVPKGLSSTPPSLQGKTSEQAAPKAGPAVTGLISDIKHRGADGKIPAGLSEANKPDPRKQIYDSTISEGYSKEQASQRQREYDYALKSGMNPDRAQQFAYALQFKEGEKKILSAEEKANVAQNVAAMPQEEKEKQGFFNDPQEFADGYAEAKARGMTEEDAVEYGKSNTAQRAMMRAGQWLAPKWTGLKSSILRAAGAKDTDHVTPEEAAEAPLVASLGGQTERDYAFNIYKDASWVDKHIGRPMGSLEAHLDNLIAGFTTPDMAALELASFGTNTLAEGGIGVGAEATEAGAKASRMERLGKGVGNLTRRVLPSQTAREGAISATETAQKALKAVQEARVPVSAQATARTIQKLTHAGFTAVMANATMQATSAGWQAHEQGDNSEALGYTLDALTSGLMTTTGILHMEAEARIRRDLNQKTGEVYSDKKFGQLNNQEQAVVIQKLIEDDPNYKVASDATDKEMERNARKLQYRHDEALRQAWNPDAVKRMVQVLDDHSQALKENEAVDRFHENFRQHYLDQITKLIDLHRQGRAEEAEYAADEQERRDSAREGRPVRKTEAAKKREEARKVTLTNAAQTAEARQGVGAAREEAERVSATQEQEAAEKATAPQEVVRHPDVVTDDKGYVSYRAHVFGGEEHNFGVTMREVPQGDGLPPKKEWGIYRKSPDGMEFLGAGGIFEGNPEQAFVVPDEATAETLAQITSLRVNAAYAVEEHGSTPEREAEHSQLRNLERQLVDGEITGEQARKAARLAEGKVQEEAKTRAIEDAEAARAGVLSGPMYGKTRAQAEEDFRAGMKELGYDQEFIDAAVGPTFRMEAENNLHHVGRSGDYIISNKGVTWRLDKYGMLQPDGFAVAPIPLMKNGRYTAQAIDLAMSGKVGFGRSPLEEQRVEVAKEHTAAQMLDNLSQDEKDELGRAVRLSQQNEGLLLETGELPAEKPVPNRKKGFAPPAMRSDVEEEHISSQETYDPLIEAIGSQIENPESYATARDIIGRVAKNSGLTPAQVIGLFREAEVKPDTLEGKIEWLRVGDTVSNGDQIPYVLESDSKGKLYLENKAGRGIKVPFDKRNPSDDVRRIVGRGEIHSAQRPQYTPEDERRIVFESSVILAQNEAIERVKELAENPPPEPRTPEQAEAQAQVTQVRAAEVKGAAIVEAVKVSDFAPGTSLTEVEEGVNKAEDLVQTAEEAEWQRIQAKAKTVSDKPFPPRAPITMGPQYTGSAGVIKHLGQSYSFHYAVVPLDRLVNSHVWDGNILVINPEYDEALQPRTISETRSGEIVLDAQLRESGSRGYDFDYYGSKGIDPLNGPAIIESGGRVAGGNTRIAMMRKHLEILEQTDDPEIERAKFRLQMAQLAHESGIKGIPDSDHDYVVVRMLDEPITTLRDASEKGMVFNTSPSHDIGEAAKGVALAKQLSDRTLEDIGKMLDEHDTLGAAIARRPQVFTDIVTNELGVSSTEHPLWFNETKNGKVLSESGRRKFMHVLMGRILDDTSVMDILQRDDPTGYTAIERAVINIVRMKATKNEPIVAKIIEAIHASATTASTGIAGEGIADRWSATYDPKATTFNYASFEVPQTPDKVIEAIWRAIHAGPRTLSDRVKAFNETDRPSRGDLLSFDTEKRKLETPTELFNRVFAKEINKQGVGKKRDVITEAEYNAALENRGNLSDEAVEDAKRSEEGKPPVAPKETTVEGGSKKMFITKRDELDLKGLGYKPDQINKMTPEEAADILSLGKQAPKGFKPPEPPSASPEVEIGQRVTFTPNNFNHNDVVGVVRDVITNTSGAKGYQIVDDAGIEHRVWERDGTIGSETKAVDQKAINSLNDEERKLRKRQVTLEAEVKKPSGMVPPAISSELNSKRGVELNDIRKRLDAIVDERRRLMQGGDGETNLAAAKSEKGYITPDELRRYLEYDFATKDHVDENMWTAQMLAERVYDADPPVGVDRKDALAWALKERVAGIGRESGAKGGAFMAETRLGRGYILLFDNAHAGTFTHEFAHAIFPLLSAEDMQAINSIEVDTTAWEKLYGKKWNFPEWDGRQESLKGEVFDGVTEKLAYGLEKFRRDEKPTGFNAQVGVVLTKIWNMFRDAYQEIIKRTKTDPLSPFKLSDDARQFFMDTFHIEETDDFNAAEDWKKKVDAARKAEAKQKKGAVKPEEALHPIIQIAKDLGPTPTHISRGSEWPIVESDGDRVAYEKTNNTIVFEYLDEENAAHAYVQATMEGSGISGVEELKGPDGKFAIRFNWGLPEKGSKEKPKEIPNSILYQEVPKRNEQLQIEKLEDLLKKTSAPFMQQFVRTQIKKLESEIRAKYGVESPKIGIDPELAKQAIAEVRDGKGKTESGRPGVSNLRGVPDGPLGIRDKGGVGRFSRAPVMGMPGHAGAGGAGDRAGAGGGERPVDLATVTPVSVVPMAERTAAPVGTLAGDKFDPKAWDEACQKAGLPRLPYPTETLSRQVAQILGKYGGETQSAQTLLTALAHGDGAVLASVPGSGKTWVISGVIKETLLKNPDAKILFITKNRKLLKDAAGVMNDGFGMEMETDHLQGKADKNIYGATYARLRSNELYKKTQWDLVIADESGEARNWHKPQEEVKLGEKPKIHQGVLLKQVMDNAKKGIYSSATPFLAPMDYGYLDKLNLWPKGEFEEWVKNFKHVDVGGKTVSQLDPVKQAKMRQQLIERGQFISQKISYDGYTIHFGVVPITDEIERKLDRIHQGVAVMRRELLKQGKKGLSEKVAAFEATYTKAFLDRARASEIIQLAKRGREQGWPRVAVMSETTSEDLFRKPIKEGGKMGTYRQLDEDTGGQISRIMPEFGNMADMLRAEFGDEIGDYSGIGNTDAQREAALEEFNSGKKSMLYMSYASGGIGVNPQDKIGDKPTLVIYTGPPYSGYLLDQALGRFWRFDTKSNVYAIILASDAKPDVDMMAQKIGPRMEALGAAVNGHRDALASVMADYTDEEKMREHQDRLAFDQGNEMKVDAQGYQVRSKRKVNFDNWSAIKIPNAEEAKNKGMKTEGFGGKGSDWATLYQEKPKRWEPPNRPLTIEEWRIRKAVNAAADAAAANPQIPHEEITMTAVRAEEVAKAAPEGVDKEAAAEGVMKTLFNGEEALQNEDGSWTVAHDAVKRMAQGIKGDRDIPSKEGYARMAWKQQFSQDSNIVFTLRKLGREEIGWNIVNMREDFIQKEDGYDAAHLHELLDIFTKNKLDPHNDETVAKIVDVIEGHRAVSDQAINKAAKELEEFHEKMRQFLADKDVSVTLNSGEKFPYKKILKKPHVAHFINYDTKLTDPETGETKTLREVMGHSFGELNRLRYMEEYARKIGKPIEEARVWIEELEKKMNGPRLGQVKGERSVNVPFYYKDFKHLVKYVRQVSTAGAMEETFGGEMQHLKKVIGKVPNEKARKDILSSFTTMFEVPDPTVAAWVTRKGQGYEFLTKMPLSVLKVGFHTVHAVLRLGPKVVGKAILNWIKNPKEFSREKYQIGVVGGRTDNVWLLTGKDNHGLGGELLKDTGFDTLYRWVRGIDGESAKVYMEQSALAPLRKGGKDAEEVRRVLKHNLLIGDHAIDEAIRTGKWSDEDLEKAQRAFANKVAFSRNPGQMPALSRLSQASNSHALNEAAAAIKGTYVLQSFTIKTYSYLREALYDEVFRYGNLKPLIPFLMFYPAAGQIMQGLGYGVKHQFNLTSEKIQGKEHKWDSFDRWEQTFKDLEHHPFAGALKLWVDGWATAAAMERTKRVCDLMLLMAEGHETEAKSMMKYWVNDELEQDFGSIYIDLKQIAEEGVGEFGDIYKYWFNPAKELTATERHVFNELEKTAPLTKQMPYVDDLAHQYIKTEPRKWGSVEGGDDEPPKEKRKKWAAPTPWD